MSLAWLLVTVITITFLVVYVYLRISLKVRRVLHGKRAWMWFMHVGNGLMHDNMSATSHVE